MFNVVLFGMLFVMDLCIRVRSRSAFLVTYDEDSVMIVFGLIIWGGYYLNVINLVFCNMFDVEFVLRFIELMISVF